MILAQKLHSKEKMEANRLKFYERFSITTVEPISAITCERYLESEKRGRVKISCRACRDRNICLTAT